MVVAVNVSTGQLLIKTKDLYYLGTVSDAVYDTISMLHENHVLLVCRE